MFCLISLASTYTIGWMSTSSVLFTLWLVYQPVSSKYFNTYQCVELNRKTADQAMATEGMNPHSMKIYGCCSHITE